MILASGILNALASWLAWRLVSLTRDCQDAPLLAGLMTSFWYLPVFGTYYYDHLAFLFVLLGFLFYLEAHGNLCRIALAALFFFAAYHAKQTVGAAGMLSLVVAILISRGREAFRDRYNYYLLYIFALFNILFLLYLVLLADPRKYLLYSILTPMDYAAVQPEKSPANLLYTILYPYKIRIDISSYQGIKVYSLYAIAMMMYFAYFKLHRQIIIEQVKGTTARFSKSSFTFLFVLLASLWCSALLGRKIEDTTFGMGIIFALAWSSISLRWIRYGLTAVFCAMALGFVYAHHGLKYAPDPYFRKTDLHPIQIRYNPNQFDLEATRAVVDYLAGKPGRIAVLDEAAALVPLALRRASWGPNSYFGDGLSIPQRPEWRRQWQEDFVETLGDRQIDYLVKVRTFDYIMSVKLRPKGRDVCCLDLPLLQRYIDLMYYNVFTFKNYCVLKRKGAARAE